MCLRKEMQDNFVYAKNPTIRIKRGVGIHYKKEYNRLKPRCHNEREKRWFCGTEEKYATVE